MNLPFSNENMIYLLIGFIITTIILILFFIKKKSGLNINSFFNVNDSKEIVDDYVMIENEKETKECVVLIKSVPLDTMGEGSSSRIVSPVLKD